MKDPYGEAGSFGNTKNSSENLMNAVVTFETKGYNQGYNQQKKVTTDDNSIKYNDLELSIKWIKVAEGYNRLGISQQAIQKHIQKGHFVTRKVRMNGGYGYEISVESMFRYYEKLGDWEKCLRIIQFLADNSEVKNSEILHSDFIGTKNDGEILGIAQNSINLSDEAASKYNITKIFDDILRNSSKKIEIAKKFVEDFNNGLYNNLKSKIGEISLRTLYRWRKKLKENNWDPACFEPEIKPSIRTISNKEAEVLIPLLLNPNRPLISEILKEAKQIFIQKGYSLKSDATYRRFIMDWRNKNIDLWTLGRYGMKAFNDKIMKDILRDKDRVEVGDIVVADGHTMNVMVINPLTGRPQRMTLVMFFDFKSSMPLGWEIMPTENILTIASALRRTILFLGRFFSEQPGEIGYIPKVIYLDNGRAFRAKYFRGVKDFKDTILPGLFGKLKIETMYATPYHGQSKTIERWFKTLGEMERRLPAYTGTDIAGKPAMLMRNEKLHQRLFDNTPITIEILAATLEEYIKEYAAQPHQDGQYKGLTPAEVFMHSINKIKQEGKYIERLISKKELIYLMLSVETRTIQKNGIRFRGNYYWNEEMPRIIGSKVIVKYDILDDKELVVLDQKERFLFLAQKDDIKYHPAARLLGEEEDVLMLTEALRNKEKRKRETVEVFKQIIELKENHINRVQKDTQGILCPDFIGTHGHNSSNSINKKKKLSEAERRNKAAMEYAKLVGIKGFINPVEELLRRAK
ncbi:MAG: transposase [Melioribacteraceae bacterium]